MVALAITATEVIPGTDATFAYGTAAESITPGDVVFLDPSTSTYKLFDANSTSLNTRQPAIALNTAGASQRLTVQTGGSITIGASAAPTLGLVYVAGATAGDINPSADIASGWRVAIIGVATSASAIKLILSNSGATLA